jgi:hypothetical protein
MMRTRNRIELILVLIVVAAAAVPMRAQQCDDGNACTTSDMCVSEECVGTPATTGSCDDGNDCTVNDRCVSLSPTERDGCMGDPAPVGTDCAAGCGTCQPVSTNPGPGHPLFCVAKPDVADQPCESGIGAPCADDRCRVLAGNFVSCLHRPKVCPDTDGNPCTDACDAETGECVVDAPRCIPVCQQCNPSNGRCEPANRGAACDDLDVCTGQSRCEVIEGFSLCVPGAPTAFTPTATPPAALTVTSTPVGDTATPTPMTGIDTPTASPTQTPTVSPAQSACVGDCNNDGQVRVNELILGTNIALALSELSECPELDQDDDRRVAISELVLSVSNALTGCDGEGAR